MDKQGYCFDFTFPVWITDIERGEERISAASIYRQVFYRKNRLVFYLFRTLHLPGEDH
jgi:hypothetical protein